MVAVSVLESTTRKFFCESGGGVTCYRRELALQGTARLRYSRLFLPEAGPSPSPVVVTVSMAVDAGNGIPTDLISNDGEELPVFAVGVRTHDRGLLGKQPQGQEKDVGVNGWARLKNVVEGWVPHLLSARSSSLAVVVRRAGEWEAGGGAWANGELGFPPTKSNRQADGAPCKCARAR